jgi:hypothetical protein
MLHLQELQHINLDEVHPFRIDPRTLTDPQTGERTPVEHCAVCGWKHNGKHLKGRPRAFYLVADGQGSWL